MRNDGHSGSHVEIIDAITLQDFDLRLTLLHQLEGSGRFVVHVNPERYNRGGLSPEDFLSSLGLHQERGCPHFDDGCYYDDGMLVRQLPAGAEYANETEAIKQWFHHLAERLPLLYAVRAREESILRDLGRPLPRRYDVLPGTEFEYSPDAEPLWVDEAAFKVMREKKTAMRHAVTEWERWRILNTLLYGSDTRLEEAVVHALTFLGLDAQRTDQGATIDVYAETYNRQHQFGIEVTGIIGQVKKKSNKLTQLTEFDRTKDGGEKPILVASTYNQLPISQRAGLDNFTQQVIDYFSGRNVLLMTGLDLFHLCGKVADDQIKAETAIHQLIEQRGEFDLSAV